MYKDFASSEEYKKLVERIQNIARLVTQCQADIPRCKDAVDKLSKTEIEIFRIYKAEIVAYLDKRETELLTEIQQRRDKDISILQTFIAHSESIKKVTEKIKTKLHRLESQPERLFISVKKVQDQVSLMQSAVKEIQQKTGYSEYEVRKDATKKAALNSDTGVATLVDLPGF